MEHFFLVGNTNFNVAGGTPTKRMPKIISILTSICLVLFRLYFIVPMPVNNQLTTLQNDSCFYLQNIREWTASDVIDWLHHEKLEM